MRPNESLQPTLHRSPAQAAGRACYEARTKPGHPNFRIFLHGNAPFADRPVAARASCCGHDVSTPPTRPTRIARRVPLRVALCAARVLVR